MKRMLLVVSLVLLGAAPAFAKEISYDDILADPAPYLNRQVTMSGLFLYSDPIRESFTFDEHGNRIEVFYRSLPKRDRDNIASQPKYSRAELTVSGILERYANSQRSYFMNATALRMQNAASLLPANSAVVSLADVQAAPEQFLNKTVTMQGSFLYADAVRESFTLNQDGTPVEVLIGDLSKLDRDALLARKEYSMTTVTVTGVIKPYANKPKTYFMNAQTVIIGK